MAIQANRATPSASKLIGDATRPRVEVPMIQALTRYTVQQLRAAGVAQEIVAEQVGISVRSVRRIEAEPPIADPSDANLRSSRRVGRSSKTASFRALVVEELRAVPNLLTVELLRRAKLKGYAGKKSAFFAMVRSVRKREVPFICRFEGLPGEFTQHDFGQVDVRFVDGTTRRVKFFASRLKWSRFAAVSLVANETAETLTRTVLEHFLTLGGIPRLAVFDRPKTVALKWEKDGKITEWNPVFAQAAMEMGFTAEVCWPYSPNQKGSVERIVGWVKTSFFKQRRFLDMEDVETQLAEWLIEANEQTPSRATGELPTKRRSEELPRLRAPRVTPDEFAIRRPIQVGRTGYVTFEGRQFSVDPGLTGRTGTLYVHRDRLRIVVDGHETVFDRRPEVSRVTRPEHRELRLKALTSRGREYGARQHVLDLGRAAELFLTELRHRNAKQGEFVARLHELLQTHGDDAMRQAFRAAVDVGRFDVDYIAALLPAREVAA